MVKDVESLEKFNKGFAETVGEAKLQESLAVGDYLNLKAVWKIGFSNMCLQ